MPDESRGLAEPGQSDRDIERAAARVGAARGVVAGIDQVDERFADDCEPRCRTTVTIPEETRVRHPAGVRSAGLGGDADAETHHDTARAALDRPAYPRPKHRSRAVDGEGEQREPDHVVGDDHGRHRQGGR